MPLRSLPPETLKLLTKYSAPPRLIAHLTVVHDVAYTLIEQLVILWPRLDLEREAVLIGAATHDIGKVIYLRELDGPGALHEEIGPQLLLENGLPAAHARFARTHARWSEEKEVQLEDLLVAFADAIWKGKREHALEEAVVKRIAAQEQEEHWHVYMKFDNMAQDLAREAHTRILWQGEHPL